MQYRKKMIMVMIFSIILLSISIPCYSNNLLENRNALSLKSKEDDSWLRILIHNEHLVNLDMYLMNDDIIILGDNLDYPDYYTYADYDIYVAKYNTNGTNLWDYRLEDDLYVKYKGFAVDSENNIYVSILVTDSSSSSLKGKMMLLKLDQNGEQLFVKYVEEFPNCNIDSMIIDLNDSIYMTGDDYQNSNDYLLKLDSDGNFIYSIILNDSAWEHGLFIDDYNNLYVFGPYSSSNSHLYKFNSTGSLLWKKEVGTRENYKLLDINNEENILAIYIQYYDSNSTYNFNLYQLNSSGEIIHKTKMISVHKYDFYDVDIWYLNSTFVSYDKWIYENETEYYKRYLIKYDNDLILNWNVSIQQYFEPSWDSLINTAYDSNSSIYFVYKRNNDIEILKINKSGGVISQDYWGGPNIERPTEIIIDSHDNLYLIADCEYVNFWNAHKDISILIKNPQSGGYPPTIEELDIKMIFVFSSLGASSTLSIIITIHIIRRKRLKI